MSNNQNTQLNLGKNNLIQADLSKLKSGIKAEEFKDNAAMLEIFKASDANNNSVLDKNEVSVFTDKLARAAGEDSTLDESEAGKLLKEEQKSQAEILKSQGKSVAKTKLKAQDLYNFTQRLQNWSNTTNVKSSVVDGDKRIVSYEDGGQQVINKDGSKIITTISGSIKTVGSLNKDGKIEKEEITDEDKGITETLVYDENGVPSSYTKTTDKATENVKFDNDGKTVKSHTVTTANSEYKIGTEGFENGKVVNEITGSGDEKKVYSYKYTGENNYTKTLNYKDTETITTVKDGKSVNVEAYQYDDNHNKVQSVVIAEDGTKTVSLYKDNNVVYDAVTDKSGKLTETRYNSQGNRLSQQITNINGKIQLAEYDGEGNTKVVVQNGETIGSIGNKFHRTTSQITSANKGHVYKDENGNPYFIVGDQVKVPGEFPANYKGLQHRNSAAQELAEYTAQEEKRVAARMEGKEQKVVSVSKNYDNWYRFAEEQLKSEGVQNPTKEQINDRTNELLMLNPNADIPKKGSKVVAIKTETDIKADMLKAKKQHAEAVKNAVVNDMQSDLDNAQKSFDFQMKKDGWAADVADAVSYIWNNDWWSATDNTARQVRQDLKSYQSTIDGLSRAKKQGDVQFKAKFKETFGVEYNQKNVEDYNAKRNKLQQVSTVVATEKAVNSRMDKLFADYDKEKALVDKSKARRSTLTDESKMRQAEYRIQQEVQSLLGLSNTDMVKLSAELKSKGKSLDVNYLKSLYGDIKKGLAENTKKALGGKSLEYYQNDVDASYKKAYGNKTDIIKRVADYNSSQDTGAAVVKTTTKLVGSAVIAAASGGTASGILVAAVGSSALSFGVDASDMMSDGLEHSSGEYVTIARNAAIDGAGQIISGGMSKALKIAEVGKVARYTAQAATDLGVDLGAEYLETGEVHLSTAITSVLASVGGEMLGDFLEARAERKIAAAAAKADADPLNDVPKNWASMTAEERQANLIERQARHKEWVQAHPDARLTEGERIAQINPEHSRYSYTVTADQMGGIQTTDLGNGVRGVVDDPGRISIDISYTQRQAIQADVAKLRTKNMTQEFVDGLETLEAVQVAKTSYTSKANGAPEFRGLDGATPWGTYRNNSQVQKMGLDSDITLVQDCGNMAGFAYSADKKLTEDKLGMWNLLTSTESENGFAAKAFEKDGTVVVALRGSDDVGDLASDFRMMAGKTPEQLDDALAFVDKIRKQYPDAKIVVTGHSLGGSLTQMVASSRPEVLGITFDAIGTKNIVAATGGALADHHNTVNYVVKGDFFSNADAHVGQVVLTDVIGDNSRHSIGNFMHNGFGNSTSIDLVEGGLYRFEQGNVGHNLAQAEAQAFNPNSLGNLIENAGGKPIVLDKDKFKETSAMFKFDVNGMNADLDALESQISHIADPAQRAKLQKMIDNRRSAITTGADIQSRSHTLQSYSGDGVNKVLMEQYGFNEPGFLGGDAPARLMVMDQDTKFVRVFNDETAFGKGAWLMPYDQVQGLTAAEIKDKFALPAMPTLVEEIQVPAGTQMFEGLCNPLLNDLSPQHNWGHGGGTQYFLVGDIKPEQYGNVRRLPTK